MMRMRDFLTLGGLTSALAEIDPDLFIYIDNLAPIGLNSYRGFYDHLAIERGASAGPRHVGSFLEDLRWADGGTFTGYKGGEYPMNPKSQVWVSQYGQVDELRLDHLEILPGRADFRTLEDRW